MEERLKALHLDPFIVTPGELGRIQADDVATFGPIVEASGFKAED